MRSSRAGYREFCLRHAIHAGRKLRIDHAIQYGMIRLTHVPTGRVRKRTHYHDDHSSHERH
jgi:hypothetical protein